MNMTLSSYITGFILSLLCTFAAYALATHHVPAFMASLGGVAVVALIVVLAFAQFAAQSLFFLRLGSKGEDSREKLVIFGATTFIVLLLVGGSLWIMNTLNQRMMPDAARMTQYMQNQAGM
jgi:cytochrome o ubiquinol oxidase operon protein cyoD